MKPSLLLLLFLWLCLPSCKKKKDEPKPDSSTSLDARYTVTGQMVDMHNTTYTGYYPHEITLLKSGPNQGTMVPKELGIPGHLILVGTSLSYYSNFGIIVTIDPTTYKITAITNHYGQPAANTRSAALDPSGENAWDPKTKNIKIKYWMDEPAVRSPHRTSFDETWTYIGPK